MHGRWYEGVGVGWLAGVSGNGRAGGERAEEELWNFNGEREPDPGSRNMEVRWE